MDVNRLDDMCAMGIFQWDDLCYCGKEIIRELVKHDIRKTSKYKILAQLPSEFIQDHINAFKEQILNDLPIEEEIRLWMKEEGYVCPWDKTDNQVE